MVRAGRKFNQAITSLAFHIIISNVYGWFVLVERGVYTLAESGRAALLWWPQPASPTAV